MRSSFEGVYAPRRAADSPEGVEALLVLGVKRSEEPYSREDLELLVSVASGLAMLLERPRSTGAAEAFDECPRCGTCYDNRVIACSVDGATLGTIRCPRLLGQRYQLERRLGRGGMGAVYEATDTALTRRVAVNVIREDLVGSPDAADRFGREARAAASFSHPNVVTVHDVGVAAGTRAFLVMEFLTGVTLRTAIGTERRLVPARAPAILEDVCAAVAAAHQHQLVHRDIKPENVFLVRGPGGERAKVLDFGIAEVIAGDAATTPGTAAPVMLGTLGYMGPEQLTGGTVYLGWDVWALAVVAYEMLCGALPFETTVVAEHRSLVLSGRFAPVDGRLPGAPASIQAFFGRAFASDPMHRPGDATGLFAECRDAIPPGWNGAAAPSSRPDSPLRT